MNTSYCLLVKELHDIYGSTYFIKYTKIISDVFDIKILRPYSR